MIKKIINMARHMLGHLESQQVGLVRDYLLGTSGQEFGLTKRRQGVVLKATQTHAATEETTKPTPDFGIEHFINGYPYGLNC